MSGKVEEGAGAGDGAVMPTMYLSHGGGPCFFMKKADLGGMADMSGTSKLADALRHAADGLKPKALLIISAHWESQGKVAVTTKAKPGLLFDYYGFPSYTYDLKWPAPGDPALAARVKSLLSGKGISCAEDSKRDFDHGVFVPMLLTFPDASIPTVQLSLRSDLDPKHHLAIGEALAPLRREGVLIIGSGFSYHGFSARADHGQKRRGAAEFDAWLNENLAAPTANAATRSKALKKWSEAPGGRLSHPREEHLLPLHVVAGAAGDDACKRTYNGEHMGGMLVSMFRFG